MANELEHAFGAQVRTLRNKLGLTQEQLAERSRLSVEAVGRLERGSFSPTLETIEKLASGLAVNFEQLFDGFQDHRPKRVRALCEMLSKRPEQDVHRAWQVLRAIFSHPSESGEFDLR